MALTRVRTGSLASIGATALQLSATSIPAPAGVEIFASAENGAGILSIGESTITAGLAAPTTDGPRLVAGARMVVPVDDVSKIWAVGSTTGLSLTWQLA